MSICPGPDCPMCAGAVCQACNSMMDPPRACTHDQGDRHRLTVALPPEAAMAPLARTRTPPYGIPKQDRTPTRPQPPIVPTQTITVDLEDADGAARFLELAAGLVRRHGRIKITISQP